MDSGHASIQSLFLVLSRMNPNGPPFHGVPNANGPFPGGVPIAFDPSLLQGGEGKTPSFGFPVNAHNNALQGLQWMPQLPHPLAAFTPEDFMNAMQMNPQFAFHGWPGGVPDQPIAPYLNQPNFTAVADKTPKMTEAFPTPSTGATIDSGFGDWSGNRQVSPPPTGLAPFSDTPAGRPDVAGTGKRRADVLENKAPTNDSTDGQVDVVGDDDYQPMAKKMALSGMEIMDDVRNKTFCTVVGRLNTVATNQTYKVPLGEIHRRISHPERMNKSTLGPVLKRGKVRGCGNDLQKELLEYGIHLENGTKKQHPVNTLTALVEGEAMRLAEDHLKLALEYFPFKDLGTYRLSKVQHEYELRIAIRELANAARYATEQLALMNMWCEGEGESKTFYMDGCPIKVLALVTHGMGPIEWINTLTIVEKFSRETCEYFEDYFKSRIEQHLPLIPVNDKRIVDLNNKLNAAPVDNPASTNIKIFNKVPGRLSLHNRPYDLTVAEMWRRTEFPESLNSSSIQSILRKGKNSTNAREMRDELLRHGIDVPAKMRKNAPATLFAGLVEGEAVQLALDIGCEVKKTLNYAAVAEILNKYNPVTDVNSIAERREGLTDLMSVLGFLHKFIDECPLAVKDYIPQQRNRDSKILEPYHIITHGFGPIEVKTWLAAIHEVARQAHGGLPHIPPDALPQPQFY